jgi:tetratricopeptide (TPR) repeat protein
LAEQIPLQQSVSLHMRAAQALEDLYADAIEPALADIARHWAAAAITGEREPAVQWAQRAGDAAMRAAGYEEAIRLYTLALECGGTALGREDGVRLHVARATAAVAAGALDTAYDDCRAAADIARSADRRDLLSEVALCLDAIGDRRWDRSVREWCIDALSGAPDDSTKARLLARLAEACVYSGAFDEGVRRAREALEVAETADDDGALVAALRARQLTLSGPEHTGERAELAARMTELGERLRRPDVEMWGRLWAIDAMWEIGDAAGVASEISKLRW